MILPTVPCKEFFCLGRCKWPLPLDFLLLWMRTLQLSPYKCSFRPHEEKETLQLSRAAYSHKHLGVNGIPTSGKVYVCEAVLAAWWLVLAFNHTFCTSLISAHWCKQRAGSFIWSARHFVWFSQERFTVGFQVTRVFSLRDKLNSVYIFGWRGTYFLFL